MTDVATTPQTVTPAPAEPAREYVAGGPSWFVLRGAVRALPHGVDDLEQELGDDLYTRMLRDSRVAGDVGLLKAAALKDGISVTPAKTPDGDARAAAQAAEAAAFVTRCLGEHLPIPLPAVLDDMLDAVAYGCRIAEQVYRVLPDGPDRGRMVVALKPKPRKNVAFVVDAYYNVAGIAVAEPGRPLTLPGLLSAGSPPPPNLIPTAKFAILTYKPKSSDPRGSTVLRAAYNWWWIKTQLLPELLKFAALFATPSLVGTTAPNAVANDPTKTPEQELLEELLQFQGGTAIAVKDGTMVKVLEAAIAGGETFFERCIALCDKQISTAIIGATRATQEAENGSRADSDTAKDLFDSIVDFLRGAIATMLQRHVVGPLLAYNSAAWAEHPPVISVGGVEAEDRTPAWAAAAALYRAGYLDPSQLPGLDAELGIPARSAEEVELRHTRATAPPSAPVAPAPATDPQEDE